MKRTWGYFVVVLHLLFNILLLILGIGLMGLGLAEESTFLADVLSEESKVGLAAVVIGVVIVVACTLNCCFALDGSIFFYYVYTGTLLLLFVALAGFFAVYGVDIASTIEEDVRLSLEHMLRHEKEFNVTTALDSIQQTLGCCGVANYTDWVGVTFHRQVPTSCCVKTGCDTTDPTSLFQQGCSESLVTSVEPLLIKIAAVGITIAVLLPIQAIFIILMARHKQSLSSVPYSQL